MKHEYLHYLMDQVSVGDDYEKLCHTLLDIPFKVNERFVTDMNRGYDGLSLRSIFLESAGKNSATHNSEPCSVLEMMVALALRIETDIMGYPGKDNPGKWFVEMLRNLDLEDMINRNFDKDKVETVIGTWLDRDYQFNGKGSLFPLTHYKHDQRNITIWDQLNIYLTENY